MAEEDSPPAEAEYGSLPVGPSLAWTHLKLSDVKAFMDIEKPEAALAFVAKTFSLTDYETNAKNAILVDFYLWILMFCKELGFSSEKTSAAFSIVRQTHEFATAPGGKTVQETFEEYKRLIIKHSLTDVSDAVVLFTPQDVAQLTKFVTGTYMQHYRLYQYAATHDQAKDQHVTHLFVDTAAAPPPLRLATMEVLDAPAPAQEEVAAEPEPPAQEEAAPPAEETEEEKQEKMKQAVADLLAKKTAELEKAMQAQMAVKMETLGKKLTGLGV